MDNYSIPIKHYLLTHFLQEQRAHPWTKSKGHHCKRSMQGMSRAHLCNAAQIFFNSSALHTKIEVHRVHISLVFRVQTFSQFECSTYRDRSTHGISRSYVCSPNLSSVRVLCMSRSERTKHILALCLQCFLNLFLIQMLCMPRLKCTGHVLASCIFIAQIFSRFKHSACRDKST